MESTNAGIRENPRLRGFSLLEMLVVIAIITTLAATLYPVMIETRDSARLRSCMSNLKQVGHAMLMYVDDNDDTFPVPWGDNNSWPTGQWVGGVTPDPNGSTEGPDKEDRPLYKYTSKNMAIWRCPSEPAYKPQGATQYMTDCKRFGNSYPMNAMFHPKDKDWVPCLAGYCLQDGTLKWGRKMSTICNPRKLIMFCERTAHNYFRGQPDMTANPELIATSGFYLNHDRERTWSPMVFVDGHVKYVLITGDHSAVFNGKLYPHSTHGLWDKDWAFAERGWHPNPEYGSPDLD